MCYYLSGEIGGYMGLLLGGFLITLFEVLDLLIYNVIVSANASLKNWSQKHKPPT